MKFWDEKNNAIPAEEVSSACDTNFNWKCKKCGYSFSSSPKVRMKSSDLCACCDRDQVRIKGVNDVFTVLPDLKRFYDFEKNKDVDIYTLAIKDKKTEIAWKCPDCGKEWSSVLAYRIDGKKGSYRVKQCQKCSGVSQRTKVADSPEHMKFWDYDKNTDLDPTKLSIFDNTSVYWHCSNCNYSFCTQIYSRTVSKNKCPCCDSNMAVSPGFNDVMTLFPSFSKIYCNEENPDIDISHESPFSKKNINCHCKECDYQWTTTINSRFAKNKEGILSDIGCPSCKGIVRTKSYSEQYPELLLSYDNENNPRPLSAITGSREDTRADYAWTCTICGNSFRATLRTMINGLSTSTKGCPYCNKNILTDKTSFAGVHPELMDEYSSENTIDPFKVFPSCKTDVIWTCRINQKHTWSANFKLRHEGMGKCPVCTNSRPVKGFNTWADKYPQFVPLFSKNNTIKLDEILYTDTTWTHWICPNCNGEYGAYTKDVATGTKLCPFCDDRRVLPGFNSFDVKHPDIMAEYDYLSNFILTSPDAFGDKCVRKLWWKCPVNEEHVYPMSPADRLLFKKRGLESCPYCKGRRRNRYYLYRPPK